MIEAILGLRENPDVIGGLTIEINHQEFIVADKSLIVLFIYN